MKWTTTYSVYNRNTGKKIKTIKKTYTAVDKARAQYLTQLFAYIDIDKSKFKVTSDSIKRA